MPVLYSVYNNSSTCNLKRYISGRIYDLRNRLLPPVDLSKRVEVLNYLSDIFNQFLLTCILSNVVVIVSIGLQLIVCIDFFKFLCLVYEIPNRSQSGNIQVLFFCSKVFYWFNIKYEATASWFCSLLNWSKFIVFLSSKGFIYWHKGGSSYLHAIVQGMLFSKLIDHLIDHSHEFSMESGVVVFWGVQSCYGQPLV